MAKGLWVIILLLAACTSSVRTPLNSLPDPSELDSHFAAIMGEHQVATVGAALIRDGKIAWTGYYGEQTPGVPTSRETLFNTGSIAKTVTAEVIMRLAEQGVLSLDEPMFPHWVDPDLVDDPRHKLLTPRLALTHRTGFPNWRYMDPEFKLRFIRAPGTAFGYSGEGLEYVAKFAEAKTGKSFDSLVGELVSRPLGVKSMAVAPQTWVIDRIVHPVNAVGKRSRPFCTGPDERRCTSVGEWSAADDLATSIESYAKFMIAIMNGQGVGGELHTDRLRVQSSTAQDEILACALADTSLCPVAQGYGLGWEIFDFGETKIASHGGSDWSERAMAYFDVETRDGIILFLNVPSSTSVEALIDGMNALDPGSKIAMLYRGWVDAYNEKQKR